MDESTPPVTPARRRAPRARRSRAQSIFASWVVTGRLPAFLLAVGLAVFAAGFLWSGDFVVRSVVVEGNKAAFADSIVADSGALGRPIFELNTDEVARRVAAHPAVALAKVSTRFPDTVVVQLTERVPAVVWQVGDHAVVADENGWVIAEAFDPTLPRIYQAKGDLPAPGTRLPDQVAEAATFINGKLGKSLGSLQYDPVTGLAAQLSDGRQIVFGDGSQLPLKLSVMDATLKLNMPWSKLDVREPDRPYVQ